MADALSRREDDAREAKSFGQLAAISQPLSNWVAAIKEEISSKTDLQDLVQRIQGDEAVGPWKLVDGVIFFKERVPSCRFTITLMKCIIKPSSEFGPIFTGWECGKKSRSLLLLATFANATRLNNLLLLAFYSHCQFQIRAPHTLLSYIPGATTVESVDNQLRIRDQVLKDLRVTLQESQSRMKKIYNQHRTEREFKVGDWVGGSDFKRFGLSIKLLIGPYHGFLQKGKQNPFKASYVNGDEIGGEDGAPYWCSGGAHYVDAHATILVSGIINFSVRHHSSASSFYMK
ncbi:hypothetical protein ACLOJK_034349, partial [Asimina triloba]